jgi:ZIP family zinc transporter
LSNNLIALYLAAFSGIVIYLATSHILPEAHSRHSSRLTMVATISGVLIMWGLVAYLHSGDAHAHGSGQEIHQEDEHGHEEGHTEEGHTEEGHTEEGHTEEGHTEEDGHQHSDNE